MCRQAGIKISHHQGERTLIAIYQATADVESVLFDLSNNRIIVYNSIDIEE